MKLLVATCLFFLIAIANAHSAPLSSQQYASQKAEALMAFNGPVTYEELKAYYQKEFAKPLTQAAFNETIRIVEKDWLNKVFKRAEEISADKQLIMLRDVVESLYEFLPHKQLENGDTVVFPNQTKFRIIVSEPHQDFFRDSGLHWNWIERFYSLQLIKKKDLDVYAAEQLSEALSVFSVSLLKLAAKNSVAEIKPEDIQKLYQSLPDSKKLSESNSSFRNFSSGTKEELLKGISKRMFRDSSNHLGITFNHKSDTDLQKSRSNFKIPLGFEGGGVSAADFDNDGFDDLYFCGQSGGVLYRNIKGKKFVDVGKKLGINLDSECRAAYFVDYDNDRDLDLFISVAGAPNRLYQNIETKSFRDVTEKVGLPIEDKENSHQVVWFDADNDGLLDLYIAQYGSWHTGAVPSLGRESDNGKGNRLYKHKIVNGQHKFEDVSVQAGVNDKGWTQSVGAWDLDNDRLPELFSINDFGAAKVYKNLGNWKFSEVGSELHFDLSYNGMNFELVDFDNQLPLEIYITEITRFASSARYRLPSEGTPLDLSAKNVSSTRIITTNKFYSQGDSISYIDLHPIVIEPVNLGWSWDASFLDYENDGDSDLFVLNGTENKGRTDVFGTEKFSQFSNTQNACFLNEQKYLYDVSSKCSLAYKGNSRAAASLDFDQDGDLDLAVNDYLSPAKLFVNLQDSNNDWVRIKLLGSKSNSAGIGAIVRITAADRTQSQAMVSGSGFLSQNSNVLHFGLGKDYNNIDVEVLWPSGLVSKKSNLSARKIHLIREQG